VTRLSGVPRASAPLGDGFSAEFLLAAACCRWPAAAARDAAVAAAAVQVRDWDGFLRIVERHRVVGLVHDALRAAGVMAPAAVAAKLAARCKAIAQRNRLLLDELSRLKHGLDAAGIGFLVLKGAPLAQLAYGAATCKQTRDIDLLVAPDDAKAAFEVLKGQGFAPLPPAVGISDTQFDALLRYGREIGVARPGSNLPVELQWRAADNATLLAGVDAASPAQEVALAEGLVVRTLAADDLFAYLCVHGAHHRWSRLKWLADLSAMLVATAADVTRLYRHAQQLGAGLCAGPALLLCRRLFDLPLPAAIAAELEADRSVARLASIALAAMTEPVVADRPLGAVSRGIYTQFLFGRGWRFFAAQCRVASASILDVMTLPLPARLHWLYPLLRPPLWLWRRASARLRR
jgi:hypothetical protein